MNIVVGQEICSAWMGGQPEKLEPKAKKVINPSAFIPAKSTPPPIILQTSKIEAMDFISIYIY